MAFLTYKKTVTDSNAGYEQIKPLKLGGRDGLIAKHVKTLKEAESRSWKLATADLLKLAGLDAADGTTVLFDVAGKDATSVCLYELVKIHGSCRDTSTQLALDFSVVVDQEIGDDAPAYAKKFEAPVPEKPRLLGETLSLSGGPGGGDWKWGTPPMQLGATVVHGHSHGHGSGEPCANCNCGRRAAAFTLIEQLVVMAIISLLASTLLPAIARTKAKPQQITSINNLKQPNLAYVMHREANSAGR